MSLFFVKLEKQLAMWRPSNNIIPQEMIRVPKKL
jgi:hypothetical protein